MNLKFAKLKTLFHKKSDILLSIALGLSLCVAGFCGYQYYVAQGVYRESGKTYNELEGYVSTVPQTQLATEAKDKEQAPMAIDWDTLKQINPDIVGWLYCEGTKINYPVTQRDNEYYLKHLFNGTYNSCGTLFMECHADSAMTGLNTILYGHSMRDKSMFGSLLDYKSQSYYEKHPTMYYLTPSKNYRIDLFSAHDSLLEEYGYETSFSSEDSYEAYLEDLQAHSDFTSTVKPSKEDKILTLSTCAYEYEDERYAVHGILVQLD